MKLSKIAAILELEVAPMHTNAQPKNLYSTLYSPYQSGRALHFHYRSKMSSGLRLVQILRRRDPFDLGVAQLGRLNEQRSDVRVVVQFSRVH